MSMTASLHFWESSQPVINRLCSPDSHNSKLIRGVDHEFPEIEMLPAVVPSIARLKETASPSGSLN